MRTKIPIFITLGEIFTILILGFISGFCTSQIMNDGKKEVIVAQVYTTIEQKLDSAKDNPKPEGLTPRYEIFGENNNCVLVCKKDRSYQKKVIYAGAGDTTLQTRMGK